MLLEKDKNFFSYIQKIMKCPYCNIIIFYINDYFEHYCSLKNNEKFIINKENIDIFLCDINEIENKCMVHKQEFTYYKNSIYYCDKCLKEKNLSDLSDFIKLEEIKLQNEEINDYKKLIENFENILTEVKEINEELFPNTNQNLVNSVKESYENFERRNGSILLYFCKRLIEFNDKYGNNLNYISTIRRISIDFNLNQLINKNNKDLIDFYNEKNIIKFNNDFKFEINNKCYSYFLSENILQKGKYYVGKIIYDGQDRKVYEGLSIKDKKLVAIKKLIKYNEEEFDNEKNILIRMNNCEFSVRYIESFEENNNMFIVTELCDGDLRNEIKENGFSIYEIKNIFCQINDDLFS